MGWMDGWMDRWMDGWVDGWGSGEGDGGGGRAECVGVKGEHWKAPEKRQ